MGEEKYGIKETNELLIALNEATVILVGLLKNGVQLGDATAFIGHLATNEDFKTKIADAVDKFDQIPKEFSTAVVGKLLKDTLGLFISSLLPLFLAAFCVALFLESIQTQFLLTFEPLKPKLSKINPIQGFKKFFSLRTELYECSR